MSERGFTSEQRKSVIGDTDEKSTEIGAIQSRIIGEKNRKVKRKKRLCYYFV